jgi:type II secretory ATPase GspE/PulE/Tfp pilus assembly ATPase PilB-like protein
LDDEIRDLVVSSKDVGAIEEVADRKGMVTLRQDGFRKVREGITTIEEVLHVAGDVRDAGEIMSAGK